MRNKNFKKVPCFLWRKATLNEQSKWAIQLGIWGWGAIPWQILLTWTFSKVRYCLSKDWKTLISKAVAVKASGGSKFWKKIKYLFDKRSDYIISEPKWRVSGGALWLHWGFWEGRMISGGGYWGENCFLFGSYNMFTRQADYKAI